MSAPAQERPPEQPTQPLPTIAGTEDLPPGGNWLMSEHAVLLIPATVVAAIVTGGLLRAYVFMTEEARGDFAVLLLVLVLVAAGAAFTIPRALGRGKDGRS